MEVVFNQALTLRQASTGNIKSSVANAYATFFKIPFDVPRRHPSAPLFEQFDYFEPDEMNAFGVEMRNYEEDGNGQERP